MDTLYTNSSRRKTRVTVMTSYNLVRSSLRLLLESDRTLSVLDIVGTKTELIEKVQAVSPDVVLICLVKDEGKNIEAVSDLMAAAPQSKLLILTTPDSLLDQTAALKLGVMGIVGTHQNARTLSRAIKQVADGEVWLNQKLIAQLVERKFSAESGGNTKSRGFYKDDLTTRELDVVGMIGRGLKNKDISEKLYISEATVRCHLSSIYGKLKVDDRLNLAIYAYRQQLVSPAVSSV